MTSKASQLESLNGALASLDDIITFWRALEADYDVDARRVAVSASALLASTKGDADALVSAVDSLELELAADARHVREPLETLLIDEATNSLRERFVALGLAYFVERRAECSRLADALRAAMLARHGSLEANEEDDEESYYSEEDVDLDADDPELVQPIIDENEDSDAETTEEIDDEKFEQLRQRLEANRESVKKRARHE